MARYTGPNNKQARRVSFSILENGKDIAKRPYGPGQHGKDKKRKQNELGKCNHFVIECVIVTSFALSEILGNFIGIYNVHTCNFFGLGIALLCVILEVVFLFKE